MSRRERLWAAQGGRRQNAGIALAALESASRALEDVAESVRSRLCDSGTICHTGPSTHGRRNFGHAMDAPNSFSRQGHRVPPH
jgi:hypothetical protein